MKQIKIWYVDFWGDLEPETFIFTNVLRKHFEVILDKENPDFVFCSHFGNEYLKYKCPRILYLGEAKFPDFNLYDYAMAFDTFQFDDRYLRLPIYLLRPELLRLALNKHTYSDDYYMSKKKFCNYVVSNGIGANSMREIYFDGLSTYRRVDSGGGYRNNLPDGRRVEDKLAFQREYRYSFAFENSAFKGYTTEKLLDAWAAATIPIYWGNPDIEIEFNKKAFINCNDFNSYNDLIDVIKKIEKDDSLYLEIMKTPILLPNSPVKEMLEEHYLENFLVHICEQSSQEALRRNSASTMWGKVYEEKFVKWDRLEHTKTLQVARKAYRGLKKIIKK